MIGINIGNSNNSNEYDDIVTPGVQTPNGKSSVSSSPTLSGFSDNEQQQHSDFKSQLANNYGNFKVPVIGSNPLTDRIIQLLGCDLRSLAAARVGLALLVVLDVYTRSRYTYDHYTDLGVLPAQQVVDSNPNHWSLFFINSSTFFANFLFTIYAIAGFTWMIGYRTKLSNFIVWVMMTSVHVRNPLVLNGGDDFFRLMIFWCMFLPTGAKFSIDSLMNLEYHNKPRNNDSTSLNISSNSENAGKQTTPIITTNPTFPSTDSQGKYYLSFATIAIMVQFCVVYYSTAYLKTGKEWNSEYSSVWIALHLDQFATRLGIWLRPFIKLGMFLTWFTIKFEWYGALLFFIPFKKVHAICRTIGAFGFMCMHIGFGSCLELGFFMYIPVASVMVFLPSWFWDTLLNWMSTPVRLNSVIYFKSNSDQVKRLLTLYKSFFLLHSTPIVQVYRQDFDQESQTQDSKLSIYQEMSDQNSWFAVANNITQTRVYGYQAFTQLIRLSPVLRFFSILVETKLFKSIYTYISTKSPSTFIYKVTNKVYPTTPQAHSRRWYIEIFCLFTIVFVINWNLAGLYDYNVPNSIRWFAPTLRLEQYWSMFSPYPSKDNGWLVIPAILNNGAEVDLYTHGLPVTYDKPELISQTFPTQRWRKYLMNLQSASHKERRLHYGRYLCREWNWYGRHPEEAHIKSFRILFMYEIIPDMPTAENPNPTKHKAEPLELWSHQC
ncbi:hypothetical protein DLAC_02606 [Tieghemostelium lacteum]|uniref:HTTM-like domain-containing protein n=1 Tax=Tieghemostelium lacteum TaxID=361077 RepID=A0A152A3A7_TIELA|nr:hypothetical protein DLAC_02606 [Tieghemostelium lacteum]|eukprot:KYR00587.1 hypothetical protein DLAC_02606 [Tieghemostelium lacteum]